MKVEWFNPIKILKPQLKGTLQHLLIGLPKYSREAIQALDISFVFDPRPMVIHTPKAHLVSHEVILQEVHLAFLWCCSYVTVAFSKMYYDKAPLNRDVVTFSDRAELAKVQLTLAWARSLTDHVTGWPEDAARPDRLDNWSEEATNLFLSSAAYIIFHEIGHLVLHKNLKDLLVELRNPFYEVKDYEISALKKAELEADAFAIESLIGNSHSNEVLLIKFIGAALAQLSNFYLLEVPDTRGGLTHPDLDDRLRTLINHSNLRDEADRIQLIANITFGLQLFLNLTGKEYIPENSDERKFKDFEELERFLFGLIDEMKNTARRT